MLLALNFKHEKSNWLTEISAATYDSRTNTDFEFPNFIVRRLVVLPRLRCRWLSGRFRTPAVRNSETAQLFCEFIHDGSLGVRITWNLEQDPCAKLLVGLDRETFVCKQCRFLISNPHLRSTTLAPCLGCRPNAFQSVVSDSMWFNVLQCTSMYLNVPQCTSMYFNVIQCDSNSPISIC